MSSEQRALDALRAADRPADLDADVAARIESEMLARFDQQVERDPVAGSGSVDDEPETVVELDDARDRRRPRTLAMVGSVAAAVLALVLGIGLVSTRDASAPATAPPSDSIDEGLVEEQLRDFCDRSIVPLAAAADLWTPDGDDTEARNDVVGAAEEAVRAMADLDAPLRNRLAVAAAEATSAVTDARRAVMLGAAGPEGDQAVVRAVDAVFAALASSSVTPLPAACRP